MSTACFIEFTILCHFPKMLQRPVVLGIMHVHMIRFKESSVAAVGVGRVATAGGTDVATADVRKRILVCVSSCYVIRYRSPAD